MHKEQILGLIRHVLTMVGVYVSQKGIIDAGGAEQIIGGIIAGVGLIWSYYSPDKKNGNGYYD